MKQILLLLGVLILGFGGVFVLSRTLEQNKPRIDESFVDEDLYFSGKQLNAVGHDFRGLIADWYWINSLQYVGNKLIGSSGNININDLRPLNPRLLYPMLDTATTLDPQFITAYSYGASILPAIDNQQAVKLLEKGIAANPDNWQLYHNLGFIYWKMKDFPKAAELYNEGAKKENAPGWMKQMGANMLAQGNSRDFAKQVYQQMFDTAEDEQTKTFAQLRFYQMESLDERDAIRPVLESFKNRTGKCPNSWREVYNELRVVKLNNNSSLFFDNNSPIDPTKVPYILLNQNNKCDVVVDAGNSKIPTD